MHILDFGQIRFELHVLYAENMLNMVIVGIGNLIAYTCNML